MGVVAEKQNVSYAGRVSRENFRSYKNKNDYYGKYFKKILYSLASGLCRSNIRTNFSLLPVANRAESLEKSTLFTMWLCWKECSSSPEIASQTLPTMGINKLITLFISN